MDGARHPAEQAATVRRATRVRAGVYAVGWMDHDGAAGSAQVAAACSRRCPDGRTSRPGSAGSVMPNWVTMMSLMSS